MLFFGKGTYSAMLFFSWEGIRPYHIRYSDLVPQVERCGQVGSFVMNKSAYSTKGPGIESPWRQEEFIYIYIYIDGCRGINS